MENQRPIRPWFRLATTARLMEPLVVPQPTEPLRPPPAAAQEQPLLPEPRPALVQTLRSPTPTETLRPPPQAQELPLLPQPRPALVQAVRPQTPTRETLRPPPQAQEAIVKPPLSPAPQSPKLTTISTASKAPSSPSMPPKKPATETPNNFSTPTFQKSTSSGTRTPPPQIISPRSPTLTRPSPPSPLLLPLSRLKFDTEPEQKNVVMKDKIQRKNDNDREKPSIFNRGGGIFSNRKKLEEEDMGMVRVITIAGENKGAYMELLASNKMSGDKGNYHARKNTLGNSDDSSDISNGRKSKDKVDSKVPVNAAFVNSNVQGANNSILFNASFAHSDPGVHFVLRKPSPATGVHQHDTNN